MNHRHSLAPPILALLFCLFAPISPRAGWVEEKDGKTTIHIKLWSLPDPTRTDTGSLADCAAVKEFARRFPRIFAEKYRDKYKADPRKYGEHNWDDVEIELTRFSGITIEGMGMDSAPLMAIAGGVSPDIIYVNFRQSDTYVQQRFLYPLDLPEDNYVAGLTQEESEFAVHPKIWPVIKRKGPDGDVHVWAMPYGGVLGKVMIYRKDLLDEANIPYPRNDWTWEDLYEACRKLTDPERGTYGIRFGRGKSESWFWVTFLWSAGGEAMVYDEAKDQWRAEFGSREAAVALEYYTRLCTEKWIDKNGKKRYGYACKDTEASQKWELGQIGFMTSYIDEKLFSTINPDIMGMVPVPLGPTGGRGAELNSRMQGIFAGVKDPVIRDAAWEYLKFVNCKDAVEIRTRIMVEGGLGRFVNPRYLRLFGYEDLIRLAPKGWEECFNIAIDTGKPEPYGRNCQLVYHVMTKPMLLAEQMSLDGDLPADKTARTDVMEKLLQQGVAEADEKMIGILTPEEKMKRRTVALLVLAAIVAAFSLVFRKIIRVFTPPKIKGAEEQATWGFRKYAWAYVLALPAVFSILFWCYIPLLMGSKMAFQNYQIMGGSTWVGVDNFANILWDGEWWLSIWNSLRYSVLVISLTFLPPIILAVLLDEIPKGKILFRTLFYLPAVINGLVVIYLWKSFYEPTEFGVLNAVVMSIPPVGYLLIGLLLFMIMWFFTLRLYIHHSYWQSGLCLAAGIVLFYTTYQFAGQIFHLNGHSRWIGLLYFPIFAAIATVYGIAAFGIWKAAQSVLGTSHDTVRKHSSTVIGIVFTVVMVGLFVYLQRYLVRIPGLAALYLHQPEPYRWLKDRETAMLCCVIPMVWAGMGPGCLIYLAALKGVAPDFYEAADIDGATFIDKILFVVVPILKPLLIIQFVGVFIGAWKNTAFILAMTGGGSSTEVAGLHIFYKAYLHLKFGPAAAMAWVLGFMLIGFTVHQLRILSRLEFKTAGQRQQERQ